MSLLLGSRLLESRDLDSLRVHVPDHVRDGAVFAAGIHPLKHEQDRSLVLGVELFLELEELGPMLLEVFYDLFWFLEAGSCCRVHIGEPETAVLDLCAEQATNLLRHPASFQR